MGKLVWDPPQEMVNDIYELVIRAEMNARAREAAEAQPADQVSGAASPRKDAPSLLLPGRATSPRRAARPGTLLAGAE